MAKGEYSWYTGSYNLSLTVEPTPTLIPAGTPTPTPTPTSVTDTGGGPIDSGQTKSGAIDFSGDTDEWTFYATKGQRVTITLDAQDSSLDPALQLKFIHEVVPAGSTVTATFTYLAP